MLMAETTIANKHTQIIVINRGNTKLDNFKLPKINCPVSSPVVSI